MAYQRRLPILLLTFILCCVIGPGDGKYSLPQRIKRQEPQIENLDGATLFILRNYRGITRPESRAQEREAEDLINLFNNQHVGKTRESNLVRFPRGQTQTLRIDLQVKTDGYYNLQMQINRQRPSGQSTSVTLVLAPDGISAANMRTAFLRSLTNQAKVCVENGSVETSVKCPGSNTGQGGSTGKGDNNGKGGNNSKGNGKGNGKGDNNSKGKGKGNNKPRGKVRS